MNKIKLLQQALENIEQVNDNSEKQIFINTDTLKYWIEKLSLSETYNIPLKEINVGYGGRGVRLFTRGVYFDIVSMPYINNSVRKVQFDSDKKYIQLDNGNIGRLMFGSIDTWQYPKTNQLWEDFQNELISYNPADYDNMNFNYIYTIEDGIRLYKNFNELFDKYEHEFDKVIKEDKIKKLEEQLNQLKEE